MKFVKSYIKIVDGLSEKLGYLFAWSTLLLVLIVSYDVITRYVFNISSVAIQELEWHLFSIIFLGGAAYTLKKNEHVRVDVIYTLYSKKTQAWINLIGTILLLIPFCLIVIWSSQNFVMMSFTIKETSPDAGGLPARYLLKGFIPLSFFFLLLQGISLAFKSFLTIKDLNEENELKPEVEV